MKTINESELRSLILLEADQINKMTECVCQDDNKLASHGSYKSMMDSLFDITGGCPIRAKKVLQGIIDNLDYNRTSPDVHTHQRQGVNVPNPATSGKIPSDEKLIGDVTEF